MNTIEILGYLGALLAGLSLGAIGSGGSIISVPVLTYVFNISPTTTTAYSLFVVGCVATIGTFKNWNKGLVDLKISLVFGLPALIGVFGIRKYILPMIPKHIINIRGIDITKDGAILVLFSILMFAAAILMISSKIKSPSKIKNTQYNPLIQVISGLTIGVITGVIGIGGGFLILPILVLYLKVPIKKAIATTLAIIALKSLCGFLGEIGTLQINWSFLIVYTIIASVGLLIGWSVSNHIDGKKLKKIFGWLVLTVAIGIIYNEIFI